MSCEIDDSHAAAAQLAGDLEILRQERRGLLGFGYNPALDVSQGGSQRLVSHHRPPELLPPVVWDLRLLTGEFGRHEVFEVHQSTPPSSARARAVSLRIAPADRLIRRPASSASRPSK